LTKLKIVKQDELKDWAEEIFKKNSFNMIDVSSKKETFRRALASGKIYVTKSGKIVQTILSIFDFFRLLFIRSDNYYRNEEHNEIGLEINIDERI